MEKNKNMLVKVIVAIFVLALVVGLVICGLKYFNKDNGSEDEEIVDILDSDERDKVEKGEYVPHVEDMDEPSNSETPDDDCVIVRK